MGEHLGWAVETSRDGEKWRFLGKGWTKPGEPLLLHGANTFVRYKPEGGKDFGDALERTGDEPMTLLDLDHGTRRDLWPTEEHHGLPVLLPGGEVGRLLRFERAADGDEFTWALEFRGERYRGPR
jgi:hypothetical protein